MNKTELIKSVSNQTQLPNATVEAVVNATLETISKTLATRETISMVGFGTFSLRDRPERVARNPRTGEDVFVPATSIPTFKPGKTLKDEVNR